MRIRSISFLSVVAILASCASLSTSKPSDDEVYKEDLTAQRPTYAVPDDTVGSDLVAKADYSAITPTADITDRLDAVLESSDTYKAETKFVDGFTIQIYTGSSSDEARIIRGKALSLMPDEDVELFYDEPSFKVKVGQYFSRLEAQRDFANLKGKFPMAIIIPDKIPIP